ncbi:PP2C family serine/threonine-protein phosphatase [Litchfieldia alkalitelluris]|uniref:PP2C family serine/threonine-protein phosphatase n=1 Tax=Litchfieldia alkalitelluris TaxID=304268 RepID=UPI00099656A8|nr:PP2C family serine/threonine-protein phosphatase [Litchfieldia alkalitelluris]
MNETEKIQVSGYQVPKKNQAVCGDQYFYTHTQDYFVCAMADGLGSGEAAFEASSAVVNVVKSYHSEDVHSIIQRCNLALKSKRGAAVAIFKIYFKSQELVYSCVGNINFYLYSPSSKLIYPLPVMGYLSGKPQVFNTQRFSYQSNSTFLFHSDGVKLRAIKGLLSTVESLEEMHIRLREYEDNRDDDFTFIGGFIH